MLKISNSDDCCLYFSNKKPESETSAVKKKANKGKEGSENSDAEKTPQGSPHPEEEDDAGVQVLLMLTIKL